MGVGRKVGEGGVSRLLLLLAGVVLLVAASATGTASDAAEGATVGEDRLHGSRRICELKCQHHHDPVNKKRCVDFCIRYQLALLFDIKEEDGTAAATSISAGEDGVCASRRICKLKCQHHHDPVNKNRCTDFCVGYQVALDAIMEDGATTTVTVGEDTLRGSRRLCELKCQHHHDPVSKKRCVDFCIRYQIALHDINDGATATTAAAALAESSARWCDDAGACMDSMNNGSSIMSRPLV